MGFDAGLAEGLLVLAGLLGALLAIIAAPRQESQLAWKRWLRK